MFVISINGAREEDEAGQRAEEGQLDYLSCKCQRTRNRKSGIKYAAAQIRMLRGKVAGRGSQSHSLPLPRFKLSSLLVLWQPLSSAASLF